MSTSFRNPRLYMIHLLRVLQDRGATIPADIYDEVADHAGVSQAQREAECKDGYPAYKNRIQFARQGLIDAGLLVGSSDEGWQRGIWELNDAGCALAASTPDDAALDATLRDLAAEGGRLRAKARKESRALAGLRETNDGDDTSSEPSDAVQELELDAPNIGDLVDEANELAMRTILEHVRSLDDRAFEYLVGQVLKASLRAESVRITQKSKDGGIDGVLSFDDLGMRIAVFEAKRYADGNTVGRPQLDAFATAARRQRAAHSLFVTSSRFSPDAVNAARSEGIRLIDGTAFVELMARHSIGLRERESYVVYEVDPAWSVNTGDDS